MHLPNIIFTLVDDLKIGIAYFMAEYVLVSDKLIAKK
jgi:hypothetical protein